MADQEAGFPLGADRLGADRQDQVAAWVIGACKQLGMQVSTADEDFFEIGGTSLIIMRLVARAEAEFGADALSPDELIEHSAIREIAASIVRNTPNRATSHQ
jgi:hypothetical protein